MEKGKFFRQRRKIIIKNIEIREGKQKKIIYKNKNGRKYFYIYEEDEDPEEGNGSMELFFVGFLFSFLFSFIYLFIFLFSQRDVKVMIVFVCAKKK